MDSEIAISLPLPDVGSVNTWLLRGDPVTLIDTGGGRARRPDCAVRR
jgi:hypothetical protein